MGSHIWNNEFGSTFRQNLLTAASSQHLLTATNDQAHLSHQKRNAVVQLNLLNIRQRLDCKSITSTLTKYFTKENFITESTVVGNNDWISQPAANSLNFLHSQHQIFRYQKSKRHRISLNDLSVHNKMFLELYKSKARKIAAGILRHILARLCLTKSQQKWQNNLGITQSSI